MVTIRDIKTICTAPEGINLLVVKVETSEPGLYGLGCGTLDRKSTRLNSSHTTVSRMPSSA